MRPPPPDVLCTACAHRAQHMTKENLERCHFFNSFFYKRLWQSMGGPKCRRDPLEVAKGYENIRRWTKNVDLFSKDYIFVPINEALHWSLAIIYRPGSWAEQQHELRMQESSAPDSTAAEKSNGEAGGQDEEEVELGDGSREAGAHRGSSTSVGGGDRIVPMDEYRCDGEDNGEEEDGVEDDTEDDEDDEQQQDQHEQLQPQHEQLQPQEDREDEEGDAVDMESDEQLQPQEDREDEEGYAVDMESDEQLRLEGGGGPVTVLDGADDEADRASGEGYAESDEDTSFDAVDPVADAPSSAVEANGDSPSLTNGSAPGERRVGNQANRPCILYLDSLGGTKDPALRLIKTYLGFEHKHKRLQVAAKTEAEPSASSSADGLEKPDKPEAALEAPPSASAARAGDDQGARSSLSRLALNQRLCPKLTVLADLCPSAWRREPQVRAS